MVRYETFKQYSDRTGLSLSSVYRAARKGTLKITEIKGVNHIIVEDETEVDIESLTNNFIDDKIENINFGKNDKVEKSYQEAEIIDETVHNKYEIDLFKNTLMTIEEMATRIEAAKDETIINLKEMIDKQEKNIDNLNDIIKTLSADNQELRTQLSIRELEINIADKKAKESDKVIEEKDKQISELLEQNKKNLEQVNLIEKKKGLFDKLFTFK
ncbi:MAG: hypothetical protein AB7V50_02480 [Vampirovibrionia bacterium]